MKKLFILTLIILPGMFLTSCLKEGENQNVYYFDGTPAVVYDVPKGDSSQYLLHSLLYNVLFLPDMLPDSLSKDGMQIKFSGVTYGEYKQIEYTDSTSDEELKTALIQILELSSAEKAQQNMVVRYGTSFGECIGYCVRTMELSKGQLKYFYESTDTVDMPELECDKKFPVDSTNLILDFVNKPVLYEMYSVYGCPDCADGGAEWIEVEHSGFYRKITFEYMNEPEELTDMVTILRRFAGYSDCLPTE